MWFLILLSKLHLVPCLCCNYLLFYFDELTEIKFDLRMVRRTRDKDYFFDVIFEIKITNNKWKWLSSEILANFGYI